MLRGRVPLSVRVQRPATALGAPPVGRPSATPRQRCHGHGAGRGTDTTQGTPSAPHRPPPRRSGLPGRLGERAGSSGGSVAPNGDLQGARGSREAEVTQAAPHPGRVVASRAAPPLGAVVPAARGRPRDRGGRACAVTATAERRWRRPGRGKAGRKRFAGGP